MKGIKKSPRPAMNTFGSVVAISILLILIVSALSVTNGVYAASLITDQQCQSVGGVPLQGIGTHEPAGQTFAPAQTSIVGFSIHVRSQNGIATPMTANIRLGGIGGAVLGSFAFSIPAGFGGQNGDWLLVQFPSGVQLTPGTSYAIDLVDNSASSGIIWDACSSPYGGGCGYSYGACLSGSWTFIEYAGDFSLAVSSQTLTVLQGSSGNVQVSVTSVNNFASPVNLALAGTASGMSGAFSINPVVTPPGGTVPSMLTVFVGGNVPAGTYQLSITGSSGQTSHSTPLTLTVVSTGSPDFSISAATPMTVAPSTTLTSTVVVTSFNSFNSAVNFTATWIGTVPSDITVNLPGPTAPPPGSTSSATLSINSGANPSIGIFGLRVTGTSGSLTHSTDVTVVVVPAITTTVTTSTVSSGFSIAAEPTSLSIIQGNSGSATVIVTSTDGFNSPVTLTASWVGNAPSGVSYSLPSPITPPTGGAGSSPMAITTTSAATSGSFTLRVAGTSGTATNTVDIIVQVVQPGPKCLIATATYGSELAPEVQLLRNFRDTGIMQTNAGREFMIVFNTWYYSFSPSVASQIVANPAERTVMEGLLLPLIGIMAVSSQTFSALHGSELAVVISGLVASSLVGAFYLGLPLGLLSIRIRRLRAIVANRTLKEALALALLVGIAIVALGELGSDMLLMVSTSIIVLSTITLSGVVISSKVAQKRCMQ